MSHLELLRVNPVDPNIFHPGFGFLKFLLPTKTRGIRGGFWAPLMLPMTRPPQRLPEVASDSYLEMALHDAWPRSNMVEKNTGRNPR